MEIFRFYDPTDIELTRNSVDENLPPDTKVGDLLAIDQDENETHTFILIPSDDNQDTDNKSFVIDGNILRTAEMFNYEQKDKYSIYVKVIDQRERTFEKALEIIIEDENDLPTDVTLSNNHVDENKPVDTYVGTFTAVDEDPYWPHSFVLLEGDGVNDAGNSLFKIEGKRLRTNEVFDFNLQQEYNIYVQVIDAAGGTLEKEFVIYINSLTGIDRLDDQNIFIYPNPAKEHINLNSELFNGQSVQIILYSNDGRIIKTQDYMPNEIMDNEIEFYFPAISDGYYMIRIQVGENVITKNILISK